MKYSLQRIFHNLRYNLPIYVFIAANFMLGAGLFITCMNYVMTSRERLEESRQKKAEGVVTIAQQMLVAFGSEEEIHDYYSISYDTYRQLSANERYTEDLEMLFAISCQNHSFFPKSQQFNEVWVYFMNENLFAYLYGFSREDDVVYLGNTAYQELSEAGTAIAEGEEIMFTGREMYIAGDSLIIDGESYSYKVVMPLEESTIMPGYDTTGNNMEKVVIFPVGAMAHLQEQDTAQFNFRSILFLRYLGDEWREDLVAQMLRELNAADNRFYFSVDDEYARLKSRMEDFNYDMDRWLFASISILLLSGVGCMGSMFLLLNKRRHMIAVSAAYGSTIRRIRMETMAEIFTVLLLGGILGILITPALKKILIYQEELRLNPAGIGIVFAAAFLFSMVSVLLGMHEVRAKNVAVTLKEN
ncbi:MAG: hypothetical protein K2I22_04565 [Lachnospiraceae bacterium]|nr:hypothetical protein [Lachnospiraceae bacterium]